MGGYGGGFNNNNNNMGAMGMNNMGGMGGMNPMGGMGNMGNMGNQGGFDPMAMAQFFKQVRDQLIGSISDGTDGCAQMGWGNFNPMMVMGQGGMMGNGMGMPGMMDPSMMGVSRS